MPRKLELHIINLMDEVNVLNLRGPWNIFKGGYNTSNNFNIYNELQEAYKDKHHKFNDF